MMLCQSYGDLNGRLTSMPSLPRVCERSRILESCDLTGQSLVRAADLARTQAGLPCVFRIGEKKYPPSIHPRRGAAIGPTIDPGSLVPPCHAARKPHIVITERKTLASEQLQFACSAASIAAEPAVRCNHPMTGNVNGHRIVVHRIAHRSGAFRRAGGNAQSLIAEHGAPGHVLELAQDFLLEPTSGKTQVDVLAQRCSFSGEITANLRADYLYG